MCMYVHVHVYVYVCMYMCMCMCMCVRMCMCKRMHAIIFALIQLQSDCTLLITCGRKLKKKCFKELL